MRILYVEDNHRDADLTIRALRKTNPSIEVEVASTIEAACARLAYVRSNPLDLVLTDMQLPDGDGLSLLKHIRENAIPVAVVVVTGMGDEESAVAALKARADDYVVKRKDYLERLQAILESALNHYRVDSARKARPLNVIYAEDDRSDLESTRSHFAVHADHIRLHEVSTAAEALFLLKEPYPNKHYDVLLLDFELPQLNALEALRELRGPLGSDIPVVLLCSPGNEELASQCLKRGATSIVVRRPGYLYQLPWELEDSHSRAELARHKAALEESESRLLLAQEAARVGTWEWDITSGMSVWSEMIWELLGLEPGDVVTSVDTFLKFIHPEDRERAFRKVSEVIAKGEEYYDEFRITPRNGQPFWVSSKGRLMRSPDGRPERMIGVNIDINERKIAEESLKTALAEVQHLKDQLHQENIYLQEEIRVASNFGEMIGDSEALEKVLKLAEQVAPLDTTVLILGETGTGKELLAHAIHKLSPRQKHSLVKVNCAALPGELIESELFGYVKGAFTGANTDRKGRFEIANDSTIFLDEVGELPLDLQAKLLRVLQDGEFDRVGDSRTVTVDVRVIAATNRDLEELVHQGRFRSDLFYRLSTFPITLPPLRERHKDISLLAKHFVEELCRKFGKDIDTIPQETMAALRNYPWPGNIRELRNVIERAVITTQGPTLRLVDTLSISRSELPLVDGEAAEDQTLESTQYNLILRTLKKTHWRIEGDYGAAAALKINPSTLRTRMKKLGITKPGSEAPL